MQRTLAISNGNSMTRRKYKKPPITEVIFKTKFSYENFDSAIPGQIFEQIKEKYSKKRNIVPITFIIGSAENVPKENSPSQTPVLQAWQNDNLALVQIGPGILIANELNYLSWENFQFKMQSLLDAYITSACPEEIQEIGLTYINTFTMPTSEKINLAEYFNLGIHVPKEMTNLSGFDLNFVNKFQNELGTEFEIKTKFIPDDSTTTENENKFILVIDCYITTTLKPDTNQILSFAAQAHEKIGEIFESIITNKTRILMEEEK